MGKRYNGTSKGQSDAYAKTVILDGMAIVNKFKKDSTIKTCLDFVKLFIHLIEFVFAKMH